MFALLQDHSEDLYDIIRVSPKDKTEVVLKAAKNMQKHITSASVHQPAWQPKSNQTEEVSEVSEIVTPLIYTLFISQS